jgi:toxin-antitoxin system PIN domain toxin
MIVPDANIFIYAADLGAPQHTLAKTWLEKALGGSERVGLAWVVLLAFLRVATKSGLSRQPMPVASAFDAVDKLLGLPTVEIIHPSRDHALILKQLLSSAGTAGNLVTDAHLAALAIENGAELVTFDRDFGRFAGLRWKLLTSP